KTIIARAHSVRRKGRRGRKNAIRSGHAISRSGYAKKHATTRTHFVRVFVVGLQVCRHGVAHAAPLLAVGCGVERRGGGGGGGSGSVGVGGGGGGVGGGGDERA